MAGAQQVTPLAKETETYILNYGQRAHTLLLNQFSLRSQLEEIDRYYMREGDLTDAQVRARLANRAGNKTKIQDVTVPIVMPQVQAACGYYTNVFLTGYPIFGIATDPANADAGLQMETVIQENAITAGWNRQLMMFFRDGLKYNLHGLEVTWDQKTTWAVDTDISQPANNGAKAKKVLWKGNCMKRMDLYNTFFDPRVHPSEIHTKGEYAGYIELVSRIQLKQIINDLYGKVAVNTVLRTFNSAPVTGGNTSSGSPFSYYQPLINPYPIMDRGSNSGIDWDAWVNNSPMNKKGIRYSSVYEVMYLYARIMPSDFGLPGPEQNTPQIWKFIIINGQVVLFAERQANIHGFLPILFGQPLEDGLDYQTKSFATNVSDMQDVASAMWNGYLASKRRLVTDRVLYDPLRVREKDINSTNPAAKIPVRPTAFGKPVQDAVYQFPFHDEQAHSLIEGSAMVVKFADLINSQNPAQQGQFVKGNKTKHEYDDIMGHGNVVNQMMCMMTEAQVFVPAKEIIKLNMLQFQADTQLYNRDKQTQVPIKVMDLRKASVAFKVADGILPSEKILSSDEFSVFFQVIGSSPAIAAGYNLSPMVSYMMKERGLDLRPFEKSPLQMQWEQQLAQWQQVAMEAIKAGSPPPPQPTMPPALQQELQQKQQAGGAQPSQTTQALQSTQGA